jgi:medium-chain acyl-[acyl-carrier-protein] hydrolase
MNEVLQRTYRLKFSDFNCHDEIAPYGVLDIFQDMAGEHADYIGIGFDDMLKKNYAWVIVRTKFEIISSPKEYQSVNVTTWPKKRGKIDFDREYEICDLDGNVLVKGISKWCIIDLKNRRVSPARDVEYSITPIEKENFPGPFSKIESFSIEGFNKVEGKTTYIDLDHNGHINNISYARYISNALAFTKEEKIKTFEINYNKELHLGDEYVLYYQKEGKTIKVCGYVKESDEISFTSLIELQ